MSVLIRRYSDSIVEVYGCRLKYQPEYTLNPRVFAILLNLNMYDLIVNIDYAEYILRQETIALHAIATRMAYTYKRVRT